MTEHAHHRMLEAGAELRRDGLARQIGDAHAKERARAEEYYAAAVDSLQRRATTAPENRAALLRARIESTREERARRLAEIAENTVPATRSLPTGCTC